VCGLSLCKGKMDGDPPPLSATALVEAQTLCEVAGIDPGRLAQNAAGVPGSGGSGGSDEESPGALLANRSRPSAAPQSPTSSQTPKSRPSTVAASTRSGLGRPPSRMQSFGELHLGIDAPLDGAHVLRRRPASGSGTFPSHKRDDAAATAATALTSSSFAGNSNSNHGDSSRDDVEPLSTRLELFHFDLGTTPPTTHMLRGLGFERWFSHLTDLVIIRQHINRLECLDSNSVPNLRRLWVSECELLCSIHHGALAGLTHLRELNLYGNNIQHIENLGHLSSLEVLNLSGNRITELGPDCFSGLRNLRELKLASNSLSFISPDAFGDAGTVLVEVNLADNSLSDWSVRVAFSPFRAPRLRKLVFANEIEGANPLCHTPAYRSHMIRVCRQLTHLDETRIFDEERDAAEASWRTEKSNFELDRRAVLRAKLKVISIAKSVQESWLLKAAASIRAGLVSDPNPLAALDDLIRNSVGTANKGASATVSVTQICNDGQLALKAIEHCASVEDHHVTLNRSSHNSVALRSADARVLRDFGVLFASNLPRRELPISEVEDGNWATWTQVAETPRVPSTLTDIMCCVRVLHACNGEGDLDGVDVRVSRLVSVDRNVGAKQRLRRAVSQIRVEEAKFAKRRQDSGHVRAASAGPTESISRRTRSQGKIVIVPVDDMTFDLDEEIGTEPLLGKMSFPAEEDLEVRGDLASGHPASSMKLLFAVVSTDPTDMATSWNSLEALLTAVLPDEAAEKRYPWFFSERIQLPTSSLSEKKGVIVMCCQGYVGNAHEFEDAEVQVRRGNGHGPSYRFRNPKLILPLFMTEIVSGRTMIGAQSLDLSSVTSLPAESYEESVSRLMQPILDDFDLGCRTSVTEEGSRDPSGGFGPQVISLDGDSLKRVLANDEVPESLLLAGHSIERIEPALFGETLEHVMSLNLSFNHLEEIPAAIGRLKHLEALNVDFNRIGSLAGLRDRVSPGLQRLSLVGNRVNEDLFLLCRSLPARLSELDLRWNPVAAEEKWRSTAIAKLEQLRILDGVGVSAAELEQSRSLSGEMPVVRFDEVDGTATLDLSHRGLSSVQDVKWSEAFEKALEYGPHGVRIDFSGNLLELEALEQVQSAATAAGMNLEEAIFHHNHTGGSRNLSRLVSSKVPSLDLSECGLFELTHLAVLSSTLAVLSVDHNEFRSLQVFSQLVNLVELYCAGNKLADVAEFNYLVPLSRLAILDVSGNELCGCERIADQKQGRASVQSPAHSRCYRAQALFKLPGLRVLDGQIVTETQRGEAREEHGGRFNTDFLATRIGHTQFQRIRELSLSGAKLRRVDVLPPATLANLTILRLDDNHLVSIHGLHDIAHQLRELDLRGNRLESMSDLCRCSFTAPRRNPLFTALRRLDLSGNRLKDFSSAHLHMFGPALEFLDLSNNELQNLGKGAWTTLTGLRVLKLNSNKIRSLAGAADSWSTLNRLEELEMRENALRNLDSLRPMQYSIRRIDFSSNRIADTAEVDKITENGALNLTNLERLSFKGNFVARKTSYRPLVFVNFLPDRVSVAAPVFYLDDILVNEEDISIAEYFLAQQPSRRAPSAIEEDTPLDANSGSDLMGLSPRFADDGTDMPPSGKKLAKVLPPRRARAPNARETRPRVKSATSNKTLPPARGTASRRNVAEPKPKRAQRVTAVRSTRERENRAQRASSRRQILFRPKVEPPLDLSLTGQNLPMGHRSRR
jgi:Leucine-rich repeat (LRR) protein